MKINLKKLALAVPLLVGIGCSTAGKPPRDFLSALNDYKGRYCNVEKKKIREDFSFVTKKESYKVLGEVKKKPESFEEFLKPDSLSIGLNAPSYNSRYEKKYLRNYNRLVKLLGFSGKIKGFSDRNSADNAFLEVEGEYFLSRIWNGEWAERTSIGLDVSYGEDDVKSSLSNKFIPLNLDVDIKDRIAGIGINLNYYPKIKLEDFLLKLTGGINYKHLDVRVDAKINNLIRIRGFDSSGEGIGYYLRVGIESKKNKFKFLPENSSFFIFGEYRRERINSEPVSDNSGFGVFFGIKKWF